MKALSIRQPWAWAICAGFKDIENRTWHTRFRGRVLIHAGKREESDDVDGVIMTVAYRTGRSRASVLAQYERECELGAIVGAATITGCVTCSDSAWFNGPYGFELSDAIRCRPVPCKGSLGFFNVPPEVAEQIRSAVPYQRGESDE